MRVNVRHLRTPEVYAEVNANLGIREVSDEAAVTIASWYASPSGVGRHLAALSTGAEVHRADVLVDVSDTIAQHYRTSNPQDQRCLDMLGTWILKQPHECSECMSTERVATQARGLRGDLVCLCEGCHAAS